MFPLIALGSIGSGIISGIGSFLAQSSAEDRAKAIEDKNFQNWLQLHVPDPSEQKVVLDKFVSQGQLDPKLQESIKQDPSAFQGIIQNQNYKATQDRALGELSDIGNQGGLRLQDKAALQEAQLKEQAQARGNRDAIASNMAQRGISGGGFDVAAKLQGQQGDADINAQNSLKVASGAQDRALQAIQSSGQLAGQLGNQDFQQQATKASAADRINQFNTQNLRDVNAANVGSQNAAQAYNLGNAQRLSDANTQAGNQNKYYNAGLVQQQYQNQLQKTAGQSGVYDKLAGQEQRQGQLAGNTISNIGSGISGGIGAQANYDLMDAYIKKQK